MKKATSTGFEYKLDDEVLDDWELLKLIKRIDNGESDLIVDLVPKLLGDEQAIELENHLIRLEEKMKISSMAREIGEIMKGSKDLKN